MFRPCSATEYCDFPNNQCGNGDQTGTCKPRPQACPFLLGRPVCACDNTVYYSECAAYADGSDLNARGTCEPPAGSFACGYLECNLTTQYCVHARQPSGADTFTCAPLPSCGAQPPSCACLADQPCGDACSGDASVGLTLVCQ